VKDQLQAFFDQPSMPVYLPGLLLDLILTALLCGALAWLYRKYGRSLSSRDSLSRTFVLLGVTTAIIISIVKSSLALSLGLVGALSIVRFRAAIKEPEELVYLFLCIAIGLGMGAEQRWATMLALGVVIPIIILRSRWVARQEPPALILTLHFSGEVPPLEAIIGLMEPHCENLHLKRVDETAGQAEMSFALQLGALADLHTLKSQLRQQYPTHRFSLLDQKTLPTF
jgi:hypothetical protein